MSESEYEPRVPLVHRAPDADPKSMDDSKVSATVARDGVVDRVACRAGDDSCAAAHASTLSRATESNPNRAEQSLLQLQRQYGNRYVEKVLARAKEESAENDVSLSVENEIQGERGGGHGLDTGVRRQMESSMGADFSGVRVHTDQRSDSLNRSLSARAFTTGHDIFFREGAYQPGSSVGRELIAHELTHVVQQNGNAVKRAMSVSQPGDPHEVEAEQTARAVMREEHSNAAGHEHKEKEDEHASVMTSAAETDGPQRQPEAVKGKDEEEEHKKGQMLVHTQREQVARKIRKAR